jgi:hypothetical protein
MTVCWSDSLPFHVVVFFSLDNFYQYLINIIIEKNQIISHINLKTRSIGKGVIQGTPPPTHDHWQGA